MPWKTFKEGGGWAVYEVDDNDAQVKKVADHDTEADANAQVKALYASVEEMTDASPEIVTESVHAVTLSEFRGGFPEVPDAPGIDRDSLLTGDNDPLFVTLPIAQVGATSRNGLLYDEALVESIQQQIVTKRPGGIFGHLKDAERGTAYPAEDVHWVGAARDGDTLWAKGYVPQGNARLRIRQMKSLGKSIATSIYGQGRFEVLKDGARRLKDFTLESLDFAPPERAALQMARQMALTAEMERSGETPDSTTTGAAGVVEIEIETTNMEEASMDREQVISELTAADVALLPEAVIGAVIAKHESDTKTQARVAELEQATETLTGERDTAFTRVAELEAQIKAVEAKEARAQFDGQVASKIAEFMNWNVSDDDAKTRLEALRKQMRRAIVAEMGDSMDGEKLAQIVTELWDTEFKALAETMRDALAGPSAIVGSDYNRDGGVIAELLKKYGSEEAQLAEAARYGFVGG